MIILTVTWLRVDRSSKDKRRIPNRGDEGRSDVMKAIDIKSSGVSDLLRELAEHDIIEPVSGHGKGKYRFCYPKNARIGDKL